ncbi:conserved hypothetical protein [Pyrobaculum islandicum DSM 4184]|uniref:HEPN domain-containing protein n=1 Tax=Pyrobaculum islandicum (strain DSM 4184 / JCM 9189 / GEO3) TaxID=384616 RepID=A1RQK1_PYRIL|nr:HEPN domain-containing protein [Pyrobaculum islandicum]ABL87233.1 conserved hypothetical protein [Pyrobaculum islandicum DSM 4184]
MHIKWLERHTRHFQQALAAFETGDEAAACYNAYVSIEALIKGALGFDPYGEVHNVKRLPALVREAFRGQPPRDVEKCAYCLERQAFSGDGATCIKCAELISEAIYQLLGRG